MNQPSNLARGSLASVWSLPGAKVVGDPTLLACDIIFMHHIHVPSGRHVLLIDSLHDAMYMKCVFVCVVYVYTCNSVDS